MQHQQGLLIFFSSRRRHTRLQGDWSSDVCSSDLGGSGLRFQPFTVEAAAVDWGTVERLVPAPALHGGLYAPGTPSGPLKNPQFTGTLEHRDGAPAPSRLTGTVRLDGRSDTLRVYADLTARP